MHVAEPKVNVTDKIVAFKRSLTPRRDALARAFEDVKTHVRRAAAAVQERTAAGQAVIPDIQYDDIRNVTSSSRG